MRRIIAATALLAPLILVKISLFSHFKILPMLGDLPFASYFLVIIALYESQ